MPLSSQCVQVGCKENKSRPRPTICDSLKAEMPRKLTGTDPTVTDAELITDSRQVYGEAVSVSIMHGRHCKNRQVENKSL